MPLRPVLIGCLLALMFAYTVAGMALVAGQERMLAARGWGSTQRVAGGPELIIELNPGGAAEGLLQLGDEIVAVNGEPVERSDYRTEAAYRRVERGGPYTLTVRRAGALHTVTLRAAPVPLTEQLTRPLVTIGLLISASFYLTGLAVFLLKPRDKQAQVFAACFATYAGAWVLPYPFADVPGPVVALVAVGYLGKQFFAPLLLHLFAIFPRPLPPLRRRPRAEYGLYLPFALSVLPLTAYGMCRWALTPAAFIEASLRYRSLVVAAAFVSLAYAMSCLGALVWQYRTAEQVGRRKLRLLMFACLIGFGPTLVLLALSRGLMPGMDERESLILKLMPFAHALQLLVPAAFAYAIVRHQVIPVRLILRRGAQYLLAKNALRALLALPFVVLAASLVAHPNRTLADILLRNSVYFYLLAAAAVALGLLFRRRLSDWIDRKFFRECYDQEKILRELIDDVRRLDSIPEMSKRVSEQVSRALHPEQVYLFYRAEGQRDLSLTYTSGGTAQELRIPEEFQLLRYAELHGGAQDFPFPPKTNLPPAEKDWLAQLGARLLVPLTGTDARLAGLLLLGEKKSEVPYTASDRELLETLAGQIAIVYENVRLKSHVERERRIKHEVLARVADVDFNVLKECPRCGACYDAGAQTCAADGAELTLTLPVERTIEGRYRLDRLLGRGGMGAVYEATDERLHRKVAVKLLTGSLFGNRDALRRFEREAQASARLHHQNIVTVHDYGRLSTEGAFLVMELVHGETFGARLKRERRLAPGVAAALFEQMLAGLQAAHEAGVVHRDLKPDNVLLSGDDPQGPRVRLLDFGLAKLTRATGGDSNSPTAAAPVTTPGAIMGTFGYMAPEQLTGGAVDARADLFAVGVMVVEALTGQRPFNGATYHELLTNVLHGTYRLPGDTPAARRLDRVLQRALAKSAAARHATAAELAAELIPALRACPPLDAPPAAAPDADTIILET
ncbi:MAG TPA: protein kinase [Pyrinomonadaceae bacterium]|jgi:hypothetical protein